MTTTLVDRVAAGLTRTIQTQGETITYVDGETEIVLTALLGRSRHSADSTGIWRIDWADQVFRIVADDLAVDGERVVPRRGARILWTKNGHIYTYDIQPLNDEPHSRPADAGSYTLTIHAKRIDDEVV